MERAALAAGPAAHRIGGGTWRAGRSGIHGEDVRDLDDLDDTDARRLAAVDGGRATLPHVRVTPL